MCKRAQAAVALRLNYTCKQTPSDSDLCFMPAVELRARLLRREVSAREVMQAHLRQIERVNPALNAIVTLAAAPALAAADKADALLANEADPSRQENAYR